MERAATEPQKTIIVITSSRELLFSAPTGQRYEICSNALCYLLLRTEGQQHQEMTQDELDESDPSVGKSLS